MNQFTQASEARAFEATEVLPAAFAAWPLRLAWHVFEGIGAIAGFLSLVMLVRRGLATGQLLAPLEAIMNVYNDTLRLLLGWTEPWVGVIATAIVGEGYDPGDLWRDEFVVLMVVFGALSRGATHRNFARTVALFVWGAVVALVGIFGIDLLYNDVLKSSWDEFTASRIGLALRLWSPVLYLAGLADFLHVWRGRWSFSVWLSQLLAFTLAAGLTTPFLLEPEFGQSLFVDWEDPYHAWYATVLIGYLLLLSLALVLVGFLETERPEGITYWSLPTTLAAFTILSVLGGCALFLVTNVRPV